MNNVIKYYLLLAGIALLALGCKLGTGYNLDKRSYIKAKDKDSIIEGYNSLRSISDSIYIEKIFEDVYDRRITHKTKYYGQSVYQAKMEALERISAVKPPKPITSDVDTQVIEFYRNWAQEEGYIK